MKKHQVSKKSYDEIKTLLKEYLNKDKKETSTQKAINPKRAINKLKKTIDKEVDNYKLILQEMGDKTPIEIMDIKNKLSELQILLSDTDIKNPKIDKGDDVEAETPTTILDENDDKDDESSLYRYDESNEYYY